MSKVIGLGKAWPQSGKSGTQVSAPLKKKSEVSSLDEHWRAKVPTMNFSTDNYTDQTRVAYFDGFMHAFVEKYTFPGGECAVKLLESAILKDVPLENKYAQFIMAFKRPGHQTLEQLLVVGNDDQIYLSGFGKDIARDLFVLDEDGVLTLANPTSMQIPMAMTFSDTVVPSEIKDHVRVKRDHKPIDASTFTPRDLGLE